MVIRHPPCPAAAHQVAARVAYVRHHRLVVAQRARHQGGGHALAAMFGGEPAVVYRGVGAFNQAGHQARQHGAVLRSFKLLGHDGDGPGRCHFAQVQSPHPIRHREQEAVRALQRPRSRDERSHRVFVMGPNLAGIRRLSILNIQHNAPLP